MSWNKIVTQPGRDEGISGPVPVQSCCLPEESRFYKSFSEKKLTGYGGGRRARIEQHRLRLLHQHVAPPGDMVEVVPGHGTYAERAVAAGWRYTAIEASQILIGVLRAKGLTVIPSWAPPIPVPDLSADVVYADQVMEHMSGIDAAREFTAEALRALRPGGVFFVVVPDYLKERTFFWDVDYTHNFVTTERRVKQLLVDGGFEILHIERAIGLARGLKRDALAAGALLVNVPGLDALSRYTGTEELLFKIRKNLFETLTFVARKPAE